MPHAAIIQTLSIIIVLYIQTLLGDGPIKYCGAKMCAYTDSHTFCRYPPGPSPSCVGYIDARLSDGEKSRVLARLNRRRSEVARGVRGLPSAADMLKLRWVEELAREAQRWADQCQPPSVPEYHDGCRDLYSITVGQCVASVVGEAPGLRFETMVDMWQMQGRLYKRHASNLTKTSHNTNDYYGDFAQMFWARSFMVGCGRSRFMVPWYGRERSVDRLVCNFAPRWADTQPTLWSSGDPASACPPRSRPDTELPSLCAYHYTMDEAYDEDNAMSLDEHMLLNTILEIERNASLDHIGSIDELYLTKLAVATIYQNPILTLPSYTINSVQKRSILQENDLESGTKTFVDSSYLKRKENDTNNPQSFHKLNIKYEIFKRKADLVGRPKTYHIDDLNDSNPINTNNYDKTQQTTTMERYINYDDYDYVEIEERNTAITTISNLLKEPHLPSAETTLRQNREESYLNKTTDWSETFPYTNFASTISLGINTEDFGIFLNRYLDSNLSISEIFNESTIYSNILDDYLSDSETVQQLQKTLDRMERNLAASTSSSGKVRRELRNPQISDEQSLNSDGQSSPEDSREMERSKTTDRGPMLSMVLKYMPYLKPLEKSIIGDSNANGSRVISPSFILFFVLYVY